MTQNDSQFCEEVAEMLAVEIHNHAMRPRHWTVYGTLPTVQELRELIGRALKVMAGAKIDPN